MGERPQHHLHPEVHKAVRMAQGVSGKEPIIKRVDDLPHNTRTVLLRPFASDRPYQIHYRRGDEQVLDHLITHELGQIVRLHRVPETERLAAVVSHECRARAARQITADGDLVPLLPQAMAPATIGDFVSDWHEAFAIQVANGPVDLRIEQWIYDCFPGLCRIQERSLTQEVHRGYDSFHSLARQLIPASIYWPTLAMNAAQAFHVTQLFERPHLLTTYNIHQLTGLGEYLTRLVLDAPDHGHRSDMVATNRWAEELRLTGWFEWQRFES